MGVMSWHWDMTHWYTKLRLQKAKLAGRGGVPVMPTLKRQRQEDCKFEDDLEGIQCICSWINTI
jgi:hypothetical protein